jgi:hypothetical protein
MHRALLLVVLSFPAIRVEAQAPPDAELKRLEAQVERVAGTDLPEFALEAFKAVRVQERALRSTFERERRVAKPALRRARQDLAAFQSLAVRAQESMGEAYELRNASLRFNSIRAFDAAALHDAEKTYREALSLAGARRFDEAKRRASQAAEQYRTVMRDANAASKPQLTGLLKRYQSAIAADLASLDHPAGTERVLARVHSARPGFGFGIGGVLSNGERLYYPPLADPPGPKPPQVPFIRSDAVADRGSMKVRWSDASDNEAGFRVLRSPNPYSTDPADWQVVAEIGPRVKLETVRYVDPDLELDTQYCYMIEAFNDAGARQSPSRCAYTRDFDVIPVWRLQLRVKVADLPGAACDDPFLVVVGPYAEFTYLDYSHDDFERGSTFTYDLNLASIHQLNDLTRFVLIDAGEAEDDILIEEITLLVNEHEVFKRRFGGSASSALQVGGNYSVEHDDLRAHPSWQAFVRESRRSGLFNLPPWNLVDNAADEAIGPVIIIIPPEQIVSRIEGIVGHALQTERRRAGNWVEWGHLFGPAVEVVQHGPSTLRVDLDLSVDVPVLHDPELDFDFDIELGKRCEDEGRKLVVTLKSANVVSDADYPFWQDVASFGDTAAAGLLINWLKDRYAPPFSIAQSIELPLTAGIDCDPLRVRVDDDASVTICCFPMPAS